MIRFLTVLVTVILCIMAVPAAWLFWVFNDRFRQCVQLENGLNLGYEAVFDLSSALFRPEAVARFADGTPLVRDKMWALFVTPSTLYGVTMATQQKRGSEFVWRADTGLILRRDDPDLYARLVDEAGHANWDFGTGSYGTEILLQRLSERPGFGARRCPTALITW